jgi:hypothetical protein
MAGTLWRQFHEVTISTIDHHSGIPVIMCPWDGMICYGSDRWMFPDSLAGDYCGKQYKQLGRYPVPSSVRSLIRAEVIPLESPAYLDLLCSSWTHKCDAIICLLNRIYQLWINDVWHPLMIGLHVS